MIYVILKDRRIPGAFSIEGDGDFIVDLSIMKGGAGKIYPENGFIKF